MATVGARFKGGFTWVFVSRLLEHNIKIKMLFRKGEGISRCSVSFKVAGGGFDLSYADISAGLLPSEPLGVLGGAIKK